MVVGCAVLLLACGGASFATPEDTANAYMKAVQARNLDGVLACLVKAEQEKFKNEKEGKKDDDGSQIVKWELGKKHMKGDDKCMIAVKIYRKSKDDSKEKASDMPVFVRKEDGQWKVSMIGMFEDFIEILKKEFARPVVDVEDKDDKKDGDKDGKIEDDKKDK